jgi:hypothetical protein
VGWGDATIETKENHNFFELLHKKKNIMMRSLNLLSYSIKQKTTIFFWFFEKEEDGGKGEATKEIK